MSPRPPRTTGWFLARYFLVSFGIALAIGGGLVFLLWVTGNRGVMSYANALFMAGAAIWVWGAIEILRSWGFTRNPRYQRGDRTQWDARDFFTRYSFPIRCAIVGTLVMGIGIASYYLFR
ncbi:MAG TPA: hypothetical protein ENF29_02770 [Candidatus Acetothermia bacterium]|nr:hypothetical protein [Candidatus Acetothermia bacterium]